MASKARRYRRSATFALVCALWASLVVTGHADPPVAPLDQLVDAQLNDIVFVDPDRGFAVGERGAIWRTEDGGRHWRLTPTPISCRWESIHFIDEQNGWIVGGYPHPLTHQSSGVVLRTKDGGRTWTAVPKLLVPALKQVHFFDAKQGLAVGDVSEFSPAGIFRSSNGGQAWMPLGGVAPGNWQSGAFHDAQRGVVVGANGSVAVAGAGQLTPARMPHLGARTVRKVAFADARIGWLVGDGGLVLRTDNSGIEWHLPHAQVPGIVLEQMDLRALAVRGTHCWIAGSPGSVVLHSADSGATWDLYRTEQAIPLRGLHFLDEQRGWAIGDLGTILATRDGGRTWMVQHQGGTRAALLALFSLPERLPLEAITRLSGNDGYLSAVEVLNHTARPARAGGVSLDERTRSAVALLGGSAVDNTWRFPVPEGELMLSPEAMIDAWNRQCAGRGVETLESHVVRKIRQWRPDVLLTERASPRGDDPLAHITNQIVLSAANKAGDPQAYPEQLQALGLPAWKVKKVFSTLPSETPGMVNLSTAQLAPRLGASLADATSTARGIVLDEYRPGATQLGFQLLMSTQSREVAVRDFFSGINLQSGGEARRLQNEASLQSLESLRRQAQRARNIQQLMARSAADQASGGSWLGQVDDLTQGLSRASASQTLYELAWRYHHSGQWHAAADAFQLVVDRYGDQELADPAALWLVQFYASSEASVRLRGGTRVMTADAGYAERPASLVQETPRTIGAPAALGDKPSLNMRAHFTTGSVGLNAQERAHRAADLAKRFQETRPRMHARPELRFPLAAAHRQIGLAQQAQTLVASFGQQGVRDGWSSCTVAEDWLARPTPAGPKLQATCKRVADKPKLDGIADEPFWKTTKALEVIAEDAALPRAQVRLAQDAEFLYLAVTCDKMKGFDYSLTDETRSHDADLALHDRVDVCLDLDRDYTTYYHLAIDYRGFTRDACLGDASWNPTWYVAASQDAHSWTVEVAIPLNELALQPPQARDAWALGLSRIMPGQGMSSWNKPAAVKVLPESFGLLLFD